MDHTAAQIAGILLRSACDMYGTATQLKNSGMMADADTVAAKAKALMNSALKDIGVEDTRTLSSAG